MASFRDDLNAYGAKNDPAMASSKNANQYADLPNPQRAEQIVTEARRRVAQSGGNPSHLPGMIQRVTNEFAQQDAAQHPDSQSYRQPNNMENYIDQVLRMSGMMGAQKSGGQSADAQGQQTYAAPSGDVERGGPLPDAAPNPDNETSTDNADGETSWDEYAAWLAAGGTAYAAYKFYQRYGRQPSAEDVDVIMKNKDTAPVSADPNVSQKPASAVDETIDAVEGANPKQARLPAPQQALPSPSSVDQSIDKTMDAELTDQQFQDRVEGRAGSETMPGPNRYNASDALPDEISPEIMQKVTAQAESGDVRGAVNLLRQNGVELSDSVLRQIVEGSNTFKSLQQRVGDVAGDAVGRSVRSAVR